MNIALVIAGGIGARMNQDIPKQFLNLEDKPIIVYTLESFQKHPEIHEIVVVCLEGWHEILKAYAKRYNIEKLTIIVNGGRTGQESIKNGLMALKNNHSDKDIILIHDAIRPMVSQEIISDSIVKCKLYGSAVAAIPCVEVMITTEDKISSTGIINRDKLIRTQTPQAFSLGKLLWAHEEAAKCNIDSSIATCSLMVELGETVHFSLGSEKNIKLTTPEDIDILKALFFQKMQKG